MNLSFDDKVQVACVLAEFTEPIQTGRGPEGMTTHYDAVGWASFDSVDHAL